MAGYVWGCCRLLRLATEVHHKTPDWSSDQDRDRDQSIRATTCVFRFMKRTCAHVRARGWHSDPLLKGALLSFGEDGFVVVVVVVVVVFCFKSVFLPKQTK